MKYQEWLKKWIEIYIKPVRKIRTYEKYSKEINLHIIPSLGSYDLDDLTPLVLQEFVVALTSEGYSSNTVNGVISVVKSSLKQAYLLNLSNKEYTNTIIRPKTEERQVECFTKKEQEEIERYILKSKKAKLFGIIICLYTGLRIGELLALKWDDIDFKKGILRVTKTAIDSWENGKYVKILESPKTKNSIREIPLAKSLITKLKEVKEQSKCDYVVPSKTEHGAQIRSYQKTFELLLKKLNIKHKGFHSLRHTFATRALECGMDIKSLSEILGHKNSQITLNRYVHAMFEYKTEMMNKLGKLMQM